MDERLFLLLASRLGPTRKANSRPGANLVTPHPLEIPATAMLITFVPLALPCDLLVPADNLGRLRPHGHRHWAGVGRDRRVSRGCRRTRRPSRRRSRRPHIVVERVCGSDWIPGRVCLSFNIVVVCCGRGLPICGGGADGRGPCSSGCGA